MKNRSTTPIIRKYFCIFAAFCIILAGIPAVPAAAANPGSYVPTSPVSGDGSAGDPYLISSPEQLAWLSAQVNSGDADICAKLTANIDMNPDGIFSPDGIPTVGANMRNWTPIGSLNGTRYVGTFDADGFTVSRLYTDGYYNGAVECGLFGCVGEGGSVLGLNVADSYVRGSDIGASYVGAIAGICQGDISSCESDGNRIVAFADSNYVGGIAGYFLGGNIADCSSACRIVTGVGFGAGGSEYVGGIAGRSDGLISECVNFSPVKGKDYVGGIAGYNEGIAVNCRNAANVVNLPGASSEDTVYVGGIAGANYGSVIACMNSGAAASDGAAGAAYIGGISGINCPADPTTASYVEDCLNVGAVAGAGSSADFAFAYAGGIVGYNCDSFSASADGELAVLTNCYNHVAPTSLTNNRGVISALSRFGVFKACYFTSGIGTDRLTGTEPATAEMNASGETSWLLNTSAGENENTGMWSIGANHPIFADEALPSVYRITYIADGNVYASQYYRAGADVTAPADPTLSTSTFVEWSPAVPATMPEEDMTLTAQGDTDYYTLTYVIDGVITKEILAAGSVITPIASPKKAGWSFTGWSPALPETMPPYDLTVTAQWSKLTYPLVFASNGGSFIPSQVLYYGDPITPPTPPSREGYIFVCWLPELPETMPASTLTVTAQWSPVVYTVTLYNGTGGVYRTLEVGYEQHLPTVTAPTRDGYTFGGWSPALPDRMPMENISATAQWTVNRYTLTFVTGGGTEIAPVTQDYGTPVNAPADPIRKGYTFDGWNKAIPATMPAADTTITALWKVNRYTISYIVDDVRTDVVYDYGEPVETPLAPQKTGYTFNGWDKSIPVTMPDEDMTITANFSINAYTITFNSAGGSITEPITLNYGAAVTPPANPVRTGYTFTGWSPALPQTMPAVNSVLTATWKVNSYTITFNTDGGTQTPSITQDYGTTVTPPAAPRKTGYTFIAWNPSVPSTMPASDMEITALYSVNYYYLRFNTAGGSEIPTIYQPYGSAVTPPAAPTRTGYTFATWSGDVPSTVPATDTDLTAVWTPNTDTHYTVCSYYMDVYGNYGVPTVSDGTGTTDTPATVPATVPEGFAVDYGEGRTDARGVNISADGTAVLRVWYSRLSFTVTFDLGGGYIDDPEFGKIYTVEREMYFGAPVEVPGTPIKDGFVFDGWDSEPPILMLAENLVLTARWRAAPTANPTLVPASDTDLAVDSGSGCISGIKPGTRREELVSRLVCGNGSIRFADGIETGSLGTGAQIVVCTSSGKEFCRYTVIVFGDVSGDGAIDSLDVSAVSRAASMLSALGKFGTAAADINGDGFVDSLDVSAISRASAMIAELDTSATVRVCLKNGWSEDAANGVMTRWLDGEMLTGWNTVGDSIYYFDPVTGAMAVGSIEIDGVVQVFGEDGVYIGTRK